MSSERLVLLLALAAALGCADLGRGDPTPDAPMTDGGGGAGPGEAGTAADGTPGPSLSFARDVHPLLVDGCARCHSSTGSASGTTLRLGEDPAKDLVVVARFVNSSNPAGSRLLTKGAGLGHGGGAIYPIGSPEHRTILDWISQGSAP